MKIIVIVTIINLISKILGFIREMSLSYFFGATYITDAYVIAVSVPTIIFGLIGSGILHSYIPMYTGIEEKIGKKAANIFTNNFLNIMLLLCIVIAVISFTFAPFLTKVFSYGFDEKTYNLTIYFIRVMIISIFFIVLTNIFSSLLQLNNRFIIIAFSGIPLNIIYILGNYISFKYNYKFLGFFSNCALFLQLICLIPYLKKINFRYRLYISLKNKYIKEIFLLGLPIIVGNSVEKINIIIDRTLASRLSEGAISILNYANILNSSVFFLTVYSGLNLIFPSLSRLGASLEIEKLKEKFNYISNMIFIFCIPITVGIIALSKLIITFFFGRGKFTNEDIYLSSNVLVCYSISFIALSFRELLTKYFYVLKNTRTPVYNSIIGIFLNIVLNLVLPKYFGIKGIAIATSISVYFITLLLWLNLYKKYRFNFNINNINVLYKVLFASFIMYLIIVICKKLNLNLFIIIIISIIIYSFILLKLNINEVIEIKNVILKKISIILKGKNNE